MGARFYPSGNGRTSWFLGIALKTWLQLFKVAKSAVHELIRRVLFLLMPLSYERVRGVREMLPVPLLWIQPRLLLQVPPLHDPVRYAHLWMARTFSHEVHE